MIKKIVLLSAITTLLSACGGSDNNSTPAAVVHQLFAQTNDADNAVLRFIRNADGSLTAKAALKTGGKGTDGVNYFMANAVAPDALTSNNSVILSADASQLYVANAGDATISVFSIDRNSGDLTLMAVSPTGGVRPVSLALANGVLYVVHQQGTAQLGAYKVGTDGKLSQLGKYTVLQADALATEVSVSPNGKSVVVNGFLKSLTGPVPGNTLLSYPINADGTLGTAVASATLGATPFGGHFASGALNNIYIVTEAVSHTLSSYKLADSGAFSGVSGPIDVAGQMAPCWISLTPDNAYAYVSNGSGTVSSFAINGSGAVTLINPVAASEPMVKAGLSSFASDSWISPDGKFLYQDYSGADKIVVYAIGTTGLLTRMGEQPAGTKSKISLQGLAGN